MKSITPMLSKIGAKADLVRSEYLYEPKLDGVRALCYLEDGKLKFINRRDRDITKRYPDLQHTSQINAKSCILDGEIIAYNDSGNPDFHLLMKRDQVSNPRAIAYLSQEIPVAYVAFDILMKDGKDLSGLPLVERKKILEDTVADTEGFQKMQYTQNGLSLWDFIMGRHLEGVVAKRSDSPYLAGKRTDNWLKIKNFKTQDCIIVGYTQEVRLISSIAIAAYYKGQMQFLGRVGTGFSLRFLKELYPKLHAIEIKEPPFPYPRHYRDTIWVKPEYVCEVKYMEFGPDGMLRTPSFMRMRDDKPLKQCIIELPDYPISKQAANSRPAANWRHRA